MVIHSFFKPGNKQWPSGKEGFDRIDEIPWSPIPPIVPGIVSFQDRVPGIVSFQDRVSGIVSFQDRVPGIVSFQDRVPGIVGLPSVSRVGGGPSDIDTEGKAATTFLPRSNYVTSEAVGRDPELVAVAFSTLPDSTPLATSSS
jgi:hypothetical protein